MSHVTQSTQRRAGGPEGTEKPNGLSGRMAVLAAVAGFVLMAVSGFLFYAASGYSAQVNADPVALIAGGATGAEVIRWASLIDMVGYLLIAPVVLYLRQRFEGDAHIGLYTAAGLSYILIGAIGAIIFATGGPPLMRAYAAASAVQRGSIVTTFTMLYQIVVVGFWQTLEGIPGGVWLLGVGTLLYGARQRAVSLVPLVLGAILLLLAVVRMLGV